jgi:hypothetical protein
MNGACDFRRLPGCAQLAFGLLSLLLNCSAVRLLANDAAVAAHFRERVQPVLETYCYACHGYGERQGGHAFDELTSDKAIAGDVKLWSAVLKNVRAGLMPPHEEERPTEAEQKKLFDWIEFEAFGIDRAEPDPGQVTLRRLNRVEYRNTVRDLVGVDYDTTDEFPADDAGYGFDNVGEALSMSPLLMEKYLNSAEEIVAEGVPAKWVDARNRKEFLKYLRFFPDGRAPEDTKERDAYARKTLQAFARRAYRRPVAEEDVDRLVTLAKDVYTTPGQTFEAGIGRAMVAVLASPKFLFRVEDAAAGSEGEKFPLVDDYALASRLSYLLWSTMPDEELTRLADRGELRANLHAQAERMVKDRRSEALAANFAGQWLRARDIEHTEIEPIGALGLERELEELQREVWRLRNERRLREGKPEYKDPDRKEDKEEDKTDAKGSEVAKDEKKDEKRDDWQDHERLRAEYRRMRELGGMFNPELRRAMGDETRAYFDYIVRENRDVMELIDSNYTFLNETLAKHYDIEGVKGDEMRRVELPVDSPRGGVLTQGTVLAVTSNPSRTSPVKRGLFILDNILGSPAPPAPPANVPILEVARDSIKDHQPTIRESQELHRRDPLCHACHARMDPLGLALENFNAMGMWREIEHGQKIDSSGELMTGEKFSGIRELKTIIKEKHRQEFYRCLTEKLLTYALGRGLEYYDEHTVDQIVAKVDQGGGRFSRLLIGVVESAPFQKQRRAKAVAAR